MYNYFFHFTCGPVAGDGNGMYTLIRPIMDLTDIKEIEERIKQDLNTEQVKSVKITNFILLEYH